jgi:RNA polymerase sigma-70 factor (ECF subfamily)
LEGAPLPATPKASVPTPPGGADRAFHSLPGKDGVPPGAASPGPWTLGAEAGLLARADAALKGGDAPRALELLDEYASSFPSGVLVEERDAERVVVLCALGRRDEARTAADAFLRDHPRSPLAARVRGSCAEP